MTYEFPSNKILEKVDSARDVIKKCMTRQGFQASPALYGGQYWTRDLFYSIDSLLELGFENSVKSHIQEIFDRQKDSGEVPTVFIKPISKGFFKFLITYMLQLFAGKRNPVSDFRHASTWHDFVCDDELTVVIALHHYVNKTGDFGLLRRNWRGVRKTIDFVNSSLENFMIRGIDWKDGLSNYDEKFCLCNQILLYHFYQCINNKRFARLVKDKINALFWNEKSGYYNDCIGGNRFELLGNSQAILFDIAPKNRVERIIKAFGLSATKFGYRNLFPPIEEEACGFPPDFYQNSSIWLHAHCYAILALIKAGHIKESIKEFIKITDLDGFNEWHYSRTGKPAGSAEQLWSAAMYLRVFNSIAKLKNIKLM
jgi:glycogen debranching enzyme